MNKDLINEMLEKMDFRGFAQAHIDGQMNWHQSEWREFIELIQRKERERIIVEIGNVVFTLKPGAALPLLELIDRLK